MVKNSPDVLDGDYELYMDSLTEHLKATGASGILHNAQTRVGSILTIEDLNRKEILIIKQQDGSWAVMGSEEDLLTQSRKDDIINSMSEKVNNRNLIPHADKWLDEGFNVLLIGLHGTGKTVSIMDLAQKKGLKMKYFSCSTLDPYTDLVGVPVPTDLLDADGNPTGKQTLRMVRPHDLDDAELIFFDELNRADPKTLNAVFEIIQFGSINGEKLPNLRACWGAINPPDEDYEVETLDPALLDRFDLYIPIEPKPSVSYMSQYLAPQTAKVLYKWWMDHYSDIRRGVRDAKIDYISPRRLLKIGMVWEASQNARAVGFALPQGGTFDKNKLVAELRIAQKSINNGEKVDVEEDHEDEDTENEYEGHALGNRPYEGFVYNKTWLRANQDKVAKFLKDRPTHYETHSAILKELESGVGGEEMVKLYGKILNALAPSQVEGMVTKFQPAKVSMMRKGMKTIHKDDPKGYKELDSLWKILGGNSPNPLLPPLA